jgi:hypothetical protein
MILTRFPRYINGIPIANPRILFLNKALGTANINAPRNNIDFHPVQSSDIEKTKGWVLFI